MDKKCVHILNAEHLGTFYRIMYLGDVMDLKNEDNKYIYTLVGKNIRRLRKKHGLTQVALAEAIGYNDGTVSNVENSSYQTFSLEFVYIISKLLNEDMCEFFKSIDDDADKSKIVKNKKKKENN